MAESVVSGIRHKGLAAAMLSGGLLLGLGPSALAAQDLVEENPAPTLQGQQATRLSAQDFAARPDDPTPFGVNLNGLVLVDGKTNGGKVVRHSATAGIDTTMGGPTAQNAALRKLLGKYVGQPMSFRLLSSIQTDITQFYRDNGRSLVSVTVPQQEITGGVVQVNVTAFVLAGATVEGIEGPSADFVNRQVRLKPGQEVDTDTLLDDVNWLNQNPFRHVSVVFQPGQAQNSTNLTLRVQAGQRTWSGYVGASNAGTEDTGIVRMYGGVNISALAWKDQQLSYQFTGSPDSLAKGRLWDTGTDKGYLSHALTYFVPLTADNGFRTKLTFGASHISSYSEPGGVFTSGSETTILNGEMSIPLPKTRGRFNLVPEVYAQVELNDYDKLQYFFGFPITQETTRLLHAVLGVRAGLSGPLFGKDSRGSADVAVVFGRRETEAFASSTYAYAKFNVKEEVFLDRERSLAFRVSGQSSSDPLHALEQMALGGDGSVRGYPVNGVASPTAASASVEYRATALPFRLGDMDATFRPHVFADVGFAEAYPKFLDSDLDGDLDRQPDHTLASIGLGGDFEVGNNVVGSLNLSHTLKASGVTKAHENSLAFQMTVRF